VNSLSFRLLSAIAIGLLIGAERERRKGEGPARSPAGIRTFAIAALLGGVSAAAGSEWLLATSAIAITVLSTAAYIRAKQDDPGLTTEAALILTVLLGGLAIHHPGQAAAAAVCVAVLLAARERIHRFVSLVLTQEELSDALIFAAGVFVVLPLMPNRYIGPFGAINPHTIWIIVILMMSVSGVGYIVVRLIGPRLGLPLAGLAAGFVSSIATISSMGDRSHREPSLSRPAIAGAVLSTVATVVELAIVVAVTSRTTLYALTFPLVACGFVAAVYGMVFTVRIVRTEVTGSFQRGRAFSLGTAFTLALTMAVMLFVSGALNAWLGKRGVAIGAALAGFADVHSVAVSVSSLVAAGKLGAGDAVLPVLAALTTNTITKMIVAAVSGKRRFALQVVPGLALFLAIGWLGAWYSISGPF
jgi:uncharacterized membrane protein (DUF4010 family)